MIKKNPKKFVMLIAGFLALTWFLIRVIPKPSRASYPCQRAAFPMASAFVIWLSTSVISLGLVKRGKKFISENYIFKGFLVLLMGLGIFFFSRSIYSEYATASTSAVSDFTPTDSPNSPKGTARGIYPGRVVWVHDEDATSWNGSSYWWSDTYTDQAVVDTMIMQSIQWLTAESNLDIAWDKLFEYFNAKRGKGKVGYSAGEKIAIKINMNNCNNPYNQDNLSNTSPHVALALVKQLVEIVGINEENITFYDLSRRISGQLYNKVTGEYPNIKFMDSSGETDKSNWFKYNVDEDCPIIWTKELTLELQGGNPTFLPQTVSEAAYLINVANLKGHDLAGVTMCAKNHFGTFYSYSEEYNYYGPKAAGVHPYMAVHDFGSGCGGDGTWDFCQRDMGTYNSLVDLMGHKDLGEKTLLFMLDALYGAPRQGSEPAKWSMSPFNNDWTSSIFVSQDGVAIESVGLDFLRSESSQTKVYGNVDNYLHEAAEANNPPSGTNYDPEGDGTFLNSLGVHEHWNNATDKKYSRNLGIGEGIELIGSAPEMEGVHANLGSGTYEGSIIVLLTSTYEDAEMFYTLDGSTPDSTSIPYNSDGIEITENTTLKAISYQGDYSPSAVQEFVYTIVLGQVGAITADKPTGMYTDSVTIFLTTDDEDVKVYYTLDHTLPDSTSNLYNNQGINIKETCTLKVIGYKNGYEPFIGEFFYSIYSSGTSIEESNLNRKCTIYPNPVNDRLTIKVGGRIPDKIYVYSETGKLVEVLYFERNSYLSLGHLPAGLYFIRGSLNKNIIFEEKFIKQ